MPKSCTCSDDYSVDRKAIDVSGQLGSLYDASSDNLIDRHSVRRSGTKPPRQRSICRIIAGGQRKELTDFLRAMDYNDAIQQSIRFQMITPSGTSRLIDYNQPINSNTRFLYYSYRSRQDKIHVKARKAGRVVAPPLEATTATHMITKILWGIEILCIIQIPKNQSVHTVDQLLDRIANQLRNDETPIRLNNDERRLISQLTNITVYGSETCVNDQNTPILTILTRIQDWQRNINFHQPLKYTMQPLRWLYNTEQFPESCEEPEQVTKSIERVRPVQTRIENQIKHLGETFENLPTRFASPTLNQRLKDVREQYRFLLDTREDLQDRLRRVITDVRRHRIKPSVINSVIEDQRYACLHQPEIETFHVKVERLTNKAMLIEKFQNEQIQYVNAFDVRLNGRTVTTNEDIDIALKRSFSDENGSVIIWYSSDRLQREQTDRWERIYQDLTLERQQTAQRTIFVYVDYSYCLQRLEGFTIVRFPATGIREARRDPSIEIVPRSPLMQPAPASSRPQHEPSPAPSKQPRRHPSPPSRIQTPPLIPLRKHPSPPPRIPVPQIRIQPSLPLPQIPVTEINVLLLGETGVGKSTFINAFVNYLKFDTLQQAERGEPVVLIPVSFLITVGDQFDEFNVTFGQMDANEDHEHQGQSVTQQCKSYVFDLNNQTRLRIIDTPGIGDTRGVAQDEKNIHHILTYINTLPYLNAVCLLLKPNASKLNVFFRSCVNQLLTYITPAGYNNIIFCFTNARATFFAPGDTGPLLRKMLHDERLSDIPFQKENTFCFDSESFRYLAARKRGIDFDDFQKHECINSWTTSVTESARLLNFIQTREPYNLQNWQSPKKLALDISMLARPLMETLRLILYNWKVRESGLASNQIVIISSPVTIDMCSNCAQSNIVEVTPIWVTQYQPGPLKNNVTQHRQCPSNGRHFLIEAIVQYASVAEPGGLTAARWQSSFHSFLLKCDRLNHFLRQQGPANQNDPFQPILDRFLDEEQQISQFREINSIANRKVLTVLRSLKQTRQQNSQQLLASHEQLTLRQVYQIIDELTAVPTVDKQIQSIKISRQLKMQAHEHRVPTNFIKNQTFAELMTNGRD